MRFFKLRGSALAGAFFFVLALSGCTAAGSSSIPEAASTPTPPPAATAESALHESTNPDTVAWLTIPGTNIDGPVQQGPDNDYYLRRDSDGNEDYRGCYFADADAIVSLANLTGWSPRTTSLPVYGPSCRPQRPCWALALSLLPWSLFFSFCPARERKRNAQRKRCNFTLMEVNYVQRFKDGNH